MKAGLSFEVTVPAHTVPARPRVASWTRFDVAEQVHVVHGVPTSEDAIAEAVKRAHIAAGVAKWRPYARESAALCSARRVATSFEREVERLRGRR